MQAETLTGQVERARELLGKVSEDGNPQHMYKATIRQFWVNASERDEAGNLIRDNRYEIPREDLLS